MSVAPSSISFEAGARPTIVLFTVCDGANPDRVACLKRLCDSIDEAARLEPWGVFHLVLIQNFSKNAELLFDSLSLKHRIVLRSPELAPISAARNAIMMALNLSERLAENSVFGFPDDDCCFPPGFLAVLKEAFLANGQLDLWTCYESRVDRALEVFQPEKMSLKDVVRTANSNTMFVRGSTAVKAGLFDERLGAGAIFSGSEDTDYCIRCYKAARQKMIVRHEIVWHRGRGVAYRAKYFPGALLAVAWNCRDMSGLIFELARKVAIGLYLVGRRELSLSRFFALLRQAAQRRRGLKRFATADNPAGADAGERLPADILRT